MLGGLKSEIVDCGAKIRLFFQSKVLSLEKTQIYLFFCSTIRTIDLMSKILSLEKTQILFGFLLNYSYLCTRFQ